MVWPCAFVVDTDANEDEEDDDDDDDDDDDNDDDDDDDDDDDNERACGGNGGNEHSHDPSSQYAAVSIAWPRSASSNSSRAYIFLSSAFNALYFT